MKFANYTEVQLVSEAFKPEGVAAGAVGYIIEIYPDDKYEVEFSRPDGVSIAQVVVGAEDIIEVARRGVS